MRVYTDNAALCVADYMAHPTYGIGAVIGGADGIETDSLIEAANICDEAVPLAIGGTERRYTCNGVVSLSETPKIIIEAMLTAMAGRCIWQAGQWRMRAGAYGDSLGAEIEFLSLDAIRRNFPEGISDLPPHQGLRGAITDDTQMTLFTAEGLIRAHVRGSLKGICHSSSLVHHALLRWYRTQGGKPRIETDNIGLVADQRLWARRAPGLTCLSSLGEGRDLGGRAKNDSKGCGTIMRVAPVAMMVPRDQVRSIAIDTSALTHGHPTGQLAAAAWAEMLADVAAGAKLEEAAAATARGYERIENGSETARAIRKALDAPRDGSPETVERLGGGWTAEEALSIALYACFAGKTFDDALQIAVFHSGDSDSTGAIAGNMMGLIDPLAARHHRWASVIEGTDVITRLVCDYVRLTHEPDGADQLAQAYPGA